MKIIKMKLLILSLAIWTNLSFNAFCSSPWDNFLQQPNKDKLMRVEKNIAASVQNCNPDVTPAQIHRTRLFELICEGNQMAFRAALLVFICWDGGELEDFNRCSGSFFEIQPRVFLQIVKDKAIADSQLKYLLTMLPLYTVDNIDIKISMIEKRMAILKSIKEKSLKGIKERGLCILKKERDNLYKIKNELDKVKLKKAGPTCRED